MFSIINWIFILLSIYLIWITTRDYYGEKDLEEEKFTNFEIRGGVMKCKSEWHAQDDGVKETGVLLKRHSCYRIRCNKYKCREKSECNCCPGYYVKASGLFFKSYSCEKCNCDQLNSCTFDWFGSKTCICPIGYSDIAGVCIADCSTNPCENGGTCIVKEKKAECLCIKPYSGERCLETNPCNPDPCKNGGRCIPSGGEATCQCPDLFAGDFCETTNPCISNPCPKDRKCVPSSGKATCQCPVGLIGEFCETEDPCFPNPCQNGGKCILSSGKATCQCFNNCTGEFCEKVTRCKRGKCEQKDCNCCSGYRLKESGFWTKSYSCQKFRAQNSRYLLLYKGLEVLLICLLYKDLFLLWFRKGKRFLSKLLELDIVNLIPTTVHPNGIYKKICDLLNNFFFNPETDDPEEDSVTEIILRCPICLRTEEEIFREGESFYALKCGHIFCDSCIGVRRTNEESESEETINVPCAVCRGTRQNMLPHLHNENSGFG